MVLRDINLITDDILERRYLLRHLVIWCSGILAVLVLAAAVYGYLIRFHYAAQPGLADGNNFTATLAQLVGEINREQGKLNRALQERAQFGALIGLQRPYSSILARLAEIMNDQTWLSQLALDTGREGTVRLKLLGFSLSQDHLGDFLQQLSRDPRFRRVVLKYSEKSEVQAYGGSPVQFQIECEISGG